MHKDSRWVSMSGRAAPVQDRARLREVWNPFAEAWFPDGLHNPNIGLIKVQVEQVDYWETSSPKPMRLLQRAVAAARGKQPDLGDSER